MRPRDQDGGQIISNFDLPLFRQLWGKSMSVLSSSKEYEALDHLPGQQKGRLSLPPQHGGWGAASGARPCELKPTPLPVSLWKRQSLPECGTWP